MSDNLNENLTTDKENNQNTSTNSEDANSKQNKKNKFLSIILSVLLLVISFVGGYFANNLIRGENATFASDIVSLMDNVALIYDEQTGETKKLTKQEIGNALVNSICDKYSKYYTQDEYEVSQQNSKGNYTGFGVIFFDNSDLVIDQVNLNSPMDRAGMKAGDEIISCIKGEETTTFNNAYELLSYINSISLNETITFVYKREGVTNQQEVKKEEYKSSYVYYLDNEYEYKFTSSSNEAPEGIANKTPTNITNESVGYIYLTKFEGNAGIELGQALDFMKERNKTKLILDLRDNGGGNMKVLTYIASYFINNNGKSNAVVAISKGKQQNQTFTTSNNRFCSFITEIKILANENTASASECLMGAFAYYKDFNFNQSNIIIEKNNSGIAKTYGKGIMQTTYELISGGAVKLTTAKMFWPDNQTTIHTKGFTKDLGCTVSEKGQALALALNSFN